MRRARSKKIKMQTLWQRRSRETSSEKDAIYPSRNQRQGGRGGESADRRHYIIFPVPNFIPRANLDRFLVSAAIESFFWAVL
jgi:hypothetical protein